MKEICDRVTEYLQTSKAYTNPDLSLSILSVATGISPRTISTSINGYLKRNFFDLINQMRVEEAKIRLRTHRDIQTIESIGADCGFRSPTPFYEAFKKSEGKTPLQWLKTAER
jgi:AraC-like DNA-binding protein